MSALEGLLRSTVEEPGSEANWLILADWLEEHDDPRRAELLRLHRKLLATWCEADRHPERSGWHARIVDLLEQGVRPCVAQTVVSLTEGVEMTFAWVPPGSFLMASPEDEAERRPEETLHRVTLTKGFWLGIHPVTCGQWCAVDGQYPGPSKRDDHPVEQVTWDEAVGFSRSVGKKTGREFRLPTEAEWEYACRAGATTPFHFGEIISTERANYDGHSVYGKGQKGKYRRKTTRVGTFPPNAFGLYDMHGNVWDWCADWFGRYRRQPVRNPKGPSSGTSRILRGGSWHYYPANCRAACRGFNTPDTRQPGGGCRLCLVRDARPGD
jgi:uncharacterized protein (TIGR02996 family)